jgi:hypothetical protein
LEIGAAFLLICGVGRCVMDIKPIETVYNGYRFRSRLEARWAVFFDELGIKYEYEPEGFEKEGYRYLPDFYLTETKTWVEVKGTWKNQSLYDFAAFLDFGCPLPGFDDSEDKDRALQCPGVLLLGGIPNISWGLVLHPLITHHKGLVREYVEFTGNESVFVIRKETDDSLAIIRAFTGEKVKRTYAQAHAENEKDLHVFFDPSPYAFETKLAVDKTINAYQAARQARFEHGQVGSPKRWAI